MKNLIHNLIRKYYLNHLSFSQEGEDKILERFFETSPNGFYVDVGAHHPIRFSNTYKLYRKGWRGINIDAMPDSMKLFKKLRPLDFNIEAAVSDTENILTYYAFNEPAINGFSKELSMERNGKKGHKIIFEKDIRTRKLSDILDEQLPQNQYIDFLSIDVEGLDINVLRSNDWNKYRPTLVLVEISDFHKLGEETEVTLYLKQQGYDFFAKTVNTVFFIKNDRS